MKSQLALVALDGAGVEHDGRWLVRGVNMTVRPGEIVTLIGPNGSGKTTTARLATGVIQPGEGKVTRKPGLKIGYVPQKIAIDWNLPLTVDRFMRLTAQRSSEVIEDALLATGVSHLRQADAGNLSGGEFQRVMLARAIAGKPDLLVLDEPVQGVDFSGEVALYNLITKIRDDIGCGILMISHDLHVVMAATDHVICLNGHVCCQGTPTSVFENEEYQRMFSGNAAGAIAFYEHDHDHTHLPDGRVRHRDGSMTDHCHPGDGHHPTTAISEKLAGDQDA